jgi:4-hydroxymandelate oxidase
MAEKTGRIDDRYATDVKYTTLRGIHRDAQRHLAEVEWNYLWCGTGDEVTLRDNTAAFDRYYFVVPLFAGIGNPDTRTNVLGFDLSFPAFIAPFWGEAVFHPDGHLAIGRAAEAAGIQQMVPVAASFPLEDIAAASSVASIFQMTFVGDEDAVVDLMQRAKSAGYKYICVTYSPIRQWRERMMEDRFSIRGRGGLPTLGRNDPIRLPLSNCWNSHNRAGTGSRRHVPSLVRLFRALSKASRPSKTPMRNSMLARSHFISRTTAAVRSIGPPQPWMSCHPSVSRSGERFQSSSTRAYAGGATSPRHSRWARTQLRSVA